MKINSLCYRYSVLYSCILLILLWIFIFFHYFSFFVSIFFSFFLEDELFTRYPLLVLFTTAMEQSSCEIAHYGKSSISIFEEVFANIGKISILGGRHQVVIPRSFSIFLIFPNFLRSCLKGALSGLRQFLATESPLKMILFIAPQKLFLFPRYLSFCLHFFGYPTKRLG